MKKYLSEKKKDFEEKYNNNEKKLSNVKFEDFILEKTVGTGSFGRVMTCYFKGGSFNNLIFFFNI